MFYVICEFVGMFFLLLMLALLLADAPSISEYLCSVNRGRQPRCGDVLALERMVAIMYRGVCHRRLRNWRTRHYWQSRV